MGQYRPMFNISIEHTYFSDGKFVGVNLVPTVESEKVISNANLVFRKREDGVTVFFDNDYLDTLRLYAKDNDEPLQINFECEVGQQNFQNFTSSTVFADNKTLFFDSSNTDNTQIGKKYLHSEDHVSSDDLVENFISPHALTPQHSSVLRFSENRALLFNDAQTQKNPRGKEKLAHDDAGSDVEMTRGIFRSLSAGVQRSPSLGLVSICVTAEELEQLTQASPQVYNDYCIKFKARETHWKYFLIGDANREGVYVKDANGEIDFDFLGEEELANGRKAKVFLSRQPIALRDRAKLKIQLLIPKNNRIKILVNRLAVASAKRINKVKVEDQELFVSEIYVNF